MLTPGVFTLPGPILAYTAKSALFTVSATADRGAFFDNTGSYTISLPAAASAGAGFSFYSRNVSGSQILDPSGAELINGAATYTVANAGDIVWAVCTGSAWVVQHAQRPSTVAITGGSISGVTFSTTDALFSVTGSSDATKLIKFEVDTQTAGKTLTIDVGAQTLDRTLTVPVITGTRTLAVIDQAQTFSATQTFAGIDATSIGATTRGTIAATTGDFNSTLAVSGITTLSDTLTMNRSQAFLTLNSTTGTNAAYTTLTTTGGTYYFGSDNSAGSALVSSGGAAYAAVVVSPASRSIILAPAGTAALTIASTGAATLASTLGVTGDFAINTNKFNVTASNGNTLVAGTLGVTGTSTFAGINATSVGVTTPGTGAFTTLSATGQFTSTQTANGVLSATNGTTSAMYLRVKNTTGDLFLGVESSSAGGFFTGSTAYDNCVWTSGRLFLRGGTGVAINGAATMSSTLGVTGVTSITDTTASTAYNNGALVVSGGVGVAGSIWAGGATGASINLYSTGDTKSYRWQYDSSNTRANFTESGVADRILVANGANGLITFKGTGGITTEGGATIAAASAFNIGAGGSGGYFAANSLVGPGSGTFTIQNGNSSNSLILSGTSGTTHLTISNGGVCTVAATTASTSTTTGALVVSGGVGVAGSLYSGAAFHFSTANANFTGLRLQGSGDNNTLGTYTELAISSTDDNVDSAALVQLRSVVDSTTGGDRGAAAVLTTSRTGTSQTETIRATSLGSVRLGFNAALSTSATDGFVYVPTCAGTPTGVPTSVTGLAPIVINTTNNKLYFYSGGSWRDAGP